jgi:hypothetical protein
VILTKRRSLPRCGLVNNIRLRSKAVSRPQPHMAADTDRYMRLNYKMYIAVGNERDGGRERKRAVGADATSMLRDDGGRQKLPNERLGHVTSRPSPLKTLDNAGLIQLAIQCYSLCFHFHFVSSTSTLNSVQGLLVINECQGNGSAIMQARDRDAVLGHNATDVEISSQRKIFAR